jgi:hypothetical protein
MQLLFKEDSRCDFLKSRFFSAVPLISGIFSIGVCDLAAVMKIFEE